MNITLEDYTPPNSKNGQSFPMICFSNGATYKTGDRAGQPVPPKYVSVSKAKLVIANLDTVKTIIQRLELSTTVPGPSTANNHNNNGLNP